MKRDWEVIREILTEAVESGPGRKIILKAEIPEVRIGQTVIPPPEDNTTNQRVYNAFLLKEMGFVQAHILPYPMTPNLPKQVMIVDVTPAGHDFYQNSMVKKPVWEKVKAILLASGVTGGTETIKLTTKYVLEQLKDSLPS